METLIECTQLDFSYDRRKPVLSSIDLQVRRGEFIGIIGPNGAGKTTLLELIQGNLKPGNGTVQVQANDPHALKPIERARSISYLLQKQELPGSATVFDLVLSGRRPYRTISGFEQVDYEIVSAAMKTLGVEVWMEREARTLSGGELQRVMLARIVAQDSPIILCDEPAAGLDPKYRISTFETLKALSARERKAIIVTVHDLSLAVTYCDRIILISGGSKRYDGKPAELQEEVLSEAYQSKVTIIRTNAGVFFLFTSACE